MNNDAGQTGGRVTRKNGEKVSLGRSCYESLTTPADLSVSGPQPLRPGNYESLKLSSLRGSSNRVGGVESRHLAHPTVPTTQRLPLRYQRSRDCMAGLFQGVWEASVGPP